MPRTGSAVPVIVKGNMVSPFLPPPSPLQVEDIDLSKNTLFLRMMPRIDYNKKRGSQRSVSTGGEGRGEEGRGGEGRTGRVCAI